MNPRQGPSGFRRDVLVDTIVAQATASGAGALAILRISGPEALVLVRGLLGGRSLPEARKAGLVRLQDPRDGADLGQAMALIYPGPRSITGEDLVEIVTYGGEAAPRAVLEALLASGGRPAAPGEFTRRGLVAGRLRLEEAEAIPAVVEARTRQGLQAGLRAMEGDLGELARAARQDLLEILAEVEAALEFPEEEPLESCREDRARELDAWCRRIERTVGNALRTELAVEGVGVVLLGPPNAGKSSIFNRLLGTARAITHARPGTTRDTLEAELGLAGHRIKLVDTAGLGETSDAVEAEGVRRSLTAARQAGLCLVVADHGAEGPRAVEALLEELPSDAVLRVLNKVDLPPPPEHVGWIEVSAKTGEGMEELERALISAVIGTVGGQQEGALALNLRQRDALTHCVKAMRSAWDGIQHGRGDEIVSLMIREALRHLEALTGELGSEELLDRIFSRFCIGK